LRDAKYAVAFTGAGISTDSGIPDFRSHDSGMWHNADPMRVASIQGFRRNPQAFYDWVKTLARKTFNAQPNPAHEALVKLEQRGILRAVITQNIDMLHTRAGTKTIFELHGHMRELTCIQCFGIFEGDSIMRKFLEDGQVPHCSKCDGVLKPNVILFGEQLPVRELMGAKEAARQADVMIIIGSSLEVEPAADIPVLARRNGAKLIMINLEPTLIDPMSDIVIHERAAQILPEIVKRVESSLIR
jgi:NAD-dependent deacetylase